MAQYDDDTFRFHYKAALSSQRLQVYTLSDDKDERDATVGGRQGMHMKPCGGLVQCRQVAAHTSVTNCAHR